MLVFNSWFTKKWLQLAYNHCEWDVALVCVAETEFTQSQVDLETQWRPFCLCDTKTSKLRPKDENFTLMHYHKVKSDQIHLNLLSIVSFYHSIFPHINPNWTEESAKQQRLKGSYWKYDSFWTNFDLLAFSFQITSFYSVALWKKKKANTKWTSLLTETFCSHKSHHWKE